MNAQGGSLSINVNEWFANCHAGLMDLPGNQNLVKQQILVLVSKSIGVESVELINIRFDTEDDKPIAIVEVAKSPKPVFVKP